MMILFAAIGKRHKRMAIELCATKETASKATLAERVLSCWRGTKPIHVCILLV
jgi:hypothetical protein